MKEFTFKVDPETYRHIKKYRDLNVVIPENALIARAFAIELTRHFEEDEAAKEFLGKRSEVESKKSCNCDKPGSPSCHCLYDYE